MPAAQFSAAAMTVELEFTKLRTAADLNAAGRHEQVRPIQISTPEPRPPAPFSFPNPAIDRGGSPESDEYTF